jgi:hypothetical protein
VPSLVAIGAPVHALGDADRRRIRLLAALYRIAGSGPVVNPLLDALLGPKAAPRTPRALPSSPAPSAARSAAACSTRSAGSACAAPTSPRCSADPGTPTLLNTGPHDPMWTTGAARAGAAQLRDGALVILFGSGHIGPLLQAAPAVVTLVNAFWRDPQATIARHRSQSARAAAG